MTRYRVPEPLSFQPFVQAGDWGWAVALCHSTPSRTRKGSDASDQLAPCPDRARGRIRRPEPLDLDFPPRDRRDPRRLPGFTGVSPLKRLSLPRPKFID